MAGVSRRWAQCLAICFTFFFQSTIAAMITNVAFDLKVGEPFEITWSNEVGPVTLGLYRPDEGKFKTITTVTNGEESFVWTPDVSGEFSFYISDGTGDNFSMSFKIAGDAPLPGQTSTPSISSATLKSLPQKTTLSESTKSPTNTEPSSKSPTKTDPSTSSTPSPTGSPPYNNEQNNPQGNENGSLSTGAKAGIGVGAAISGILAFATIAYLFYRRGKAAGARGGGPEKDNDDGNNNLAELGETGNRMPCPELEPVAGRKGTRAGGVSGLPVDGENEALKSANAVYEMAS